MNIREYQSPFSYRYGDGRLSYLWSQQYTRQCWRMFWGALLHRQQELGLVSLSPEQDKAKWGLIGTRYTDEDWKVAQSLEERTKHDLVAELEATARKYPSIANLLHVGTTSSDIQDATTLRQLGGSRSVIQDQLLDLRLDLADFVKEHAETVTMGYTHLMPAEPTTIGYRFASYLRELLISIPRLSQIRLPDMEIRGAVGTGANMLMLDELGGWDGEPLTHQAIFLGRSKTAKSPLAYGQTYPRIYEFRIVSVLAEIASILHKMALDVRLMMSKRIITKRTSEGYVGSSALPGKVNPIEWEKICGLSRRMPLLLTELWNAHANSTLERTLDDSAPRRTLLPEAFLLMSEIIGATLSGLSKIEIDEEGEMENVLNSWRVWLPSRMLAYLRANDKDISQKDLYEAAQGVLWSKAFIDVCDPDHPALEDYDLSEFLCLDFAINTAKRVAKHAREAAL